MRRDTESDQGPSHRLAEAGQMTLTSYYGVELNTPHYQGTSDTPFHFNHSFHKHCRHLLCARR